MKSKSVDQLANKSFSSSDCDPVVTNQEMGNHYFKIQKNKALLYLILSNIKY